MATASDCAPSLPQTTGPKPATSDGPTTAAPAPSPRMMQVLRSVMSSQPEKRSAATTRTLRACPVSTAADAALSA